MTIRLDEDGEPAKRELVLQGRAGPRPGLSEGLPEHFELRRSLSQGKACHSQSTGEVV